MIWNKILSLLGWNKTRRVTSPTNEAPGELDITFPQLSMLESLGIPPGVSLVREKFMVGGVIYPAYATCSGEVFDWLRGVLDAVDWYENRDADRASLNEVLDEVSVEFYKKAG